jgi:hypothetical protein
VLFIAFSVLKLNFNSTFLSVDLPGKIVVNNKLPVQKRVVSVAICLLFAHSLPVQALKLDIRFYFFCSTVY